MGMRYAVSLEGREAMIEIEPTDGGWRYRLDGEDGSPGPWTFVAGRWTGAGELALQGADRVLRYGTFVQGETVALQVDGHGLTAQVVDPRRARADLAGGAGAGVVSTPMPGVVVRIPVVVGEQVRAGQVLVVVEAMKMENEFKAPADGVVEAVEVEVGQTLESGAVLVRVGSES